MILIWFKRLNGDENDSLNICIKMISGFKPMILWTMAWAYGGPGHQIIIETFEIWESIWREMLPYKDIWTIKSYAGFEIK